MEDKNENRIEVEEKFFVYNIEEIEKIAKLNKFCVKDFFWKWWLFYRYW